MEASVSFYIVKECAPDKERGKSIFNSGITTFSSSLLPPPLTKKGVGWGALCFCYRFADSEMLEIENRCFIEVISTLENSEFKMYVSFH